MPRYFLFFHILLFAAAGAWADHPFDPKRYAYEVFSEDEIALSKYAGKLDEGAVITILEQSWAELDSAAARSAGLPPEEAKSAIRVAVRGEGGISEKFDSRLKQISENANPAPTLKARVKQAVRHPAFLSIVALFALALFWINRKKN